ncbi:MAG: WbqC family protein [Paludibacteraceae bacterium]|nr:WbqC family protein [Paludibacteraceae bacterium]
MILPTAYCGPKSYFEALMSGEYEIEQMETFEKQTFRNRCLIRDPKGEIIRLTVPVGKVEHKQLTRDIEISYQSKWQHQHWIAIESAYRHKPYFLYFADYLRQFYERETKWLLDLNDGLTETIVSLLRKERPAVGSETALLREVRRTADWSGTTWTDKHPWQKEISVLDTLFDEN